MKNFAPIALFVYNRPMHTRLTVEALLLNSQAMESDLYIFSDAPKNEEAREAVEEVRSYIEKISGFKTIQIIKRNENLGLAKSIIDGVTALCAQFGKVIVLEDDLETSPYFLEYMNEALLIYKDDDKLGSVSGYMYPVKLEIADQTFFSNMPQSWGWGTWDRAWVNFNSDGAFLLKKLKELNLIELFNKNGPHNYTKMLKDQISEKNNSWYIRWYASLLFNKKLTLMPKMSLVSNIGIDGTGTHCAEWRYNPFDGKISQKPIHVVNKSVKVNPEIESSLKNYYKKVKLLRYINYIYRILNIRRKHD